MSTKSLNSILKVSIGLFVGAIGLNAQDIDAKTIIDTKCIACHTETSQGLSRISEQRKTPEGWFMTVDRMQKDHGLVLTKKEEQSVVKYLSDTQGLNYDENINLRYILEQTPNYQENFENSTFVEMCARCHSGARVGIQRRTQSEWDNLVNFHLGKFPTLEYQALARDRDWLNLAQTEIVPYLAKTYGNDKKFELKEIEFEGNWNLVGHKLGDGDFSATLKLTKTSKDNYKVILNGTFIDGRKLEASGTAIVYSGYEFRAKLDIQGVSYNQVFAVNPETLQLTGSMFETLHPEEYSYVKGLKSTDKKTAILGVYPSALKAGKTTNITIIGNNLDKNIKLSQGLKLNKILEASSNKLVLNVTASSSYDVKQIDFTLNSKKFEKEFTVYKKLDGLSVTPSYAISRIGDGGGAMPKQNAIFEAYGIIAGSDGKIGTADDINIGKVDAKWSIEPFDERAKEDEDVKYVGTMDSFTGRFTPSFAGPNPLRKFSTNNAGNIKVVATYKEGKEIYKADSHMMVTVQKWVNPPIN
ncbi:quinohemoprotein amine dehydrogenase subunit alpha [Aliarcobacter butzleri]|uniref:quinohemoprotein amine dehydrogenase subunit alpha n=1 Tax=Aliarcobacter butzleri TaxID=28197 RepID=UPI001EDB9C6B|nr:quinohemoprotein amine dehydrogenase subunit alpha [Aliarcobacter butzleri]MCG3709625.1 quinohemoprotein amine dehydrogenase subunit alpha [Aliarcobacter butzleri]MCG3714493.1 quinohemoprotein amine dehydrogenase subunit alpha [Aliarcobacter butzleri]